MRLQFDPAMVRHLFGGLTIPLRGNTIDSVIPFSMALGIVLPESKTQPHCHQEDELFIMLSGYGCFVSEDGRLEVRAGEVVFARALCKHHFENSHATEELRFVKIWWEDRTTFMDVIDGAFSRLAECAPNVLVTATPPTPNGDLHVGHLSGPYLRADVYTRFLRLTGRRAYYLSGIDDHQSYVGLKAEQLQKAPQDTAQEFGDRMISTLRSAHIELDWIGQPRSSSTHIPFVQKLLRQLHTSGHLIPKNTPAVFCERCNEFLFEAYVSGHCPHCDAPSNGNACEVCGLPNDCADLREPRCNRCGSTTVLRPYERLYFPLSPHAKALTEYWNSVHMGAHLRSLCARMLDAGLPDIAVSHRANWGIQVPLAGFESQRIYVWFEMAAGYLAATQDLFTAQTPVQDWSACWRERRWDVVQFFGYDNGYFHAILFPALWKLVDERIRLPVALITNEFYRLDGQKFSTSRNHAIWGPDLFARVPADMARLYLAYTGPDTQQTNFTMAALTTFVRSELNDGWDAWLRTLGRAVHQEYAGRTPRAGLWTDEHITFFYRLREIVARVGTAYSARSFSLQEAAHGLCDLVRIAHNFAHSEAHWSSVEVEQGTRRTGLVLQLSAARTLAILAEPLMPSFASSLWTKLGYHSNSFAGSWERASELIEEGAAIGELDCPHFQSVRAPP